MKTQDQITDYDKEQGYIHGCISGTVNGWIEGFIEGFTKEGVENLLEKLQNDILKTDTPNTNEVAKEKIIDQITKVIFKQYSKEIESIQNEAYRLMKNENKEYTEVMDILFK